MLRKGIADDWLRAQRAEVFGMLAAIRSEEYAAAQPEEIARRRLFFRRLLEDIRRRGRLDVGAVQFARRQKNRIPTST